MSLSVVGHVGSDVFVQDGVARDYVGGSMFHFLNGYALSGAECEALTWTSTDLAGRASDRLPDRITLAALRVPNPPRFEIRYEGERLTRFDISNLEMPEGFPDLVGHRETLHCTAMPLTDVIAILDKARPKTWSLQLHESVLPTTAEFDALPSRPSYIFCNTVEYLSFPADFRARPDITWVVTDRHRVRVLVADQLRSTYAFEPTDDVVDPTGAGDVFAGATLGATCQGVDIDFAVRFGVGAAAIVLSDWSSEAFAHWWQ
jgi:hypothetical protein